MSISPLAMLAKKTIESAWLTGDAYDLATQAAEALESAQMLQAPETAAGHRRPREASAYSTAFQALTSSRPLSPNQAAQLLADLRKEDGLELADAIERDLSGKYRRTPTDTEASFRRKRRDYGAAMRIVNAFRHLAAAPLRPTLPPQRNRSTS